MMNDGWDVAAGHGPVGVDPVSLGLDVARMMGPEALVNCPFHDDASPSAAFNVAKGLFICYGCGARRNAKQVADELGGELFVIPIAEIKGAATAKTEDVWEWVLQRPYAIDNPYLVGRGISNELIREYEIRDAVIGVGFVLRNNRNQPIGVQVRKYAGEPKYLFLGDRPPVWPFRNLARNVYVTEGVFGVLQAAKYGIKAVAAMGAGVTDETAGLLSNFHPTIVFDADYPGYLGAAKMIVGANARVVIPAPEADSDDWHKIVQQPTTNNVSTLADLSGNPVKLQGQIKQYQKKRNF